MRRDYIWMGSVVALLSLIPRTSVAEKYRWSHAEDDQPLETRFAPPSSYARLTASENSFTAWLRNLPLKPGRPDVLLFNGSKKNNQTAHLAVVDIDVGQQDLQQCADAVMRIRAEYLKSAGREADICFRFTSGDAARWTDWSQGMSFRCQA